MIQWSEGSEEWRALTVVVLGDDKDVEGQDIGVQCLEGVLRIEKVRMAVWAAESKDSQAPKVIEG